jgi:hypothetical protein
MASKSSGPISFCRRPRGSVRSETRCPRPRLRRTRRPLSSSSGWAAVWRKLVPERAAAGARGPGCRSPREWARAASRPSPPKKAQKEQDALHGRRIMRLRIEVKIGSIWYNDLTR